MLHSNVLNCNIITLKRDQSETLRGIKSAKLNYQSQ